MSIRYKTALVFLLTGLVPFLAIGTLVFLDFQSALRNNAFQHLEAVTNLQEERVDDLITGSSGGIAYLSSLPQLRQSVQTYLQDPTTGPQLRQVLTGLVTVGPAAQSTPLAELAVTDLSGKVLESTDASSVGTTLPVRPNQSLTDIVKDQRGVRLLFNVPMSYDGEDKVRLYLITSGESLFDIASNREGLGETGEIFLVKRLNDKTGVFVTPLRFDADAALTREVPLDQTNRPSAQAVLKKDQIFTSGVVSYRDKPVIGVTRYIESAGLGMVGQIDESEVFGPVEQLALQVVVFGALLVLFTVFVSSFMSELFVRPVLNLAAAANKISRGDFSARSKVRSSDEIGQLGHTFNNMAEDLEKQDKAKSDVLALISHQLRTPVTAVKGFVSLVLQDKNAKLSQEETKMLQLAFDENEKLNTLITQILEVAHADSGKLALNKQPTDLAKLVQKVVKDHAGTLKLRNQTVDFTPPAATITVNVDSEKMGFVLGNLITNASKYSPAGSKIVMAMGQGEKNYWIRVSDFGLGISRADLRKLFQKFSRIENPKSETAEGMGLGLYMSKKIVELHKGDLKVSSRENHGSSFTIELPINE